MDAANRYRCWPTAALARSVVLVVGASFAVSVPAQPTSEEVRRLLERREIRAEGLQVRDLRGEDPAAAEAHVPETAESGGPAPAEGTPDVPQGQFVLRTDETVTMQAPTGKTDLPGGIVISRLASEESAGADGWFYPTLSASPMPAVWDTAGRRYNMRLSLGLRAEGLPSDASLDEPVTVRFGFRGLEAKPFEPVTIERAGVEHEKQLTLDFLPTTEQPVLEMRSTITDIDFELEALPRIELRPVRNAMYGLGLGDVEIRVMRLLPHGDPAVPDADVTATVEVTGSARPEPRTVTIRKGEANASFMLHSRGTGPVDVRVTAGGLTDSRTIDQQFPTGPVLFTLAGGALGGFARRFVRRARGAGTSTLIAEGLVVAVIAFVAGVLGVGYVNLPSAVVASEAGAFLVGAVAGFVGVTVMEGLRKRFFAPAG